MKKIVYILVLLFVSSSIMAQVSFVAKVSKSKVGMNERLRVDFVVDRDGDNFVAPNFDGFKAQGPNQSVSRSWVNGKSSFNKTFTYYLTPQKLGKQTIGQATIQFKGNTYKTSPATVQVTPAVNKPKGGENPNYVADNSLHLVARVSNKNPYLNEGISLEYILYWDADVSISAPQDLALPKFTDFWSQNIEVTQLNAEETTYNGAPSGKVVLKKYVLYPQKTGKLKLEPLTINVPVRVPSNRRDFFGQRVMQTVNKNISAGSLNINVKPLPSNAPDGFTGAVGQFNLNVSQTKKSLNANESLQVKVKVSGKGNLKLFELPKLKAPASIEIYDPESKPSIRTTIGGMKGSLTDTYTMVPQFKGTFPIPNIKFAYFDPKQNKYKQLTANNISIDVLQGPVQNSVTVNQPIVAPDNSNRNSPATNTSFKFIKSTTSFTSIDSPVFFNTRNYWLLLLLPLLVIPVIMLLVKQRNALAKDIVGSKARKASRLVKKYLSSAKKNLGDSKAFYESLERALHNYLKANLNIDTNEMNKERIQELLEKRSIENNTISGYLSVLETCEMARYTPATLQTMEEDFEKASLVITQMDKQW